MADARHSVHEMLQHASIPTLVMCLAQITEDDRLCARPKSPQP